MSGHHDDTWWVIEPLPRSPTGPPAPPRWPWVAGPALAATVLVLGGVLWAGLPDWTAGIGAAVAGGAVPRW